MDTSELLPSLAQGELSETSTPELVAAVFRSRASGTLWMETEDSEIRCFFRAGDMCGTGPFKGFQTLAHVLLANDWVAALDIESSRDDAAARGLRHGEVLVERGLLTPDQLRTALGAQHTANLTTLLGLTQGKYDWRGWEPPPAWAREVVVDPVSCVIDALEQEQHAPRRRRVLEWLGKGAARLSLDWPELQGRVMLGPFDRRAAALLALPRRLDEFVQASRLAQTRAEALLVGLLLAGGAEPQPQVTAPPPVRSEPPRRAPEPKPVRAEPPRREPEPKPVRAEPPRREPPRRAPPPPRAVEPEPLDPEPFDAEAEPFDPDQLEPLQLEGEDDPLREPVLEPLPEQQPHPDPFDEPQLQPLSGPPLELDDAPRLAPGRRSSPPPRRASVNEDEALARLDSLSLDEETPPPAEPEPQEEPLEIDHGSGPQSSGDDLRKKLLARGLRNLGTIQAPQHEESHAVEDVRTPSAARLDESALSPEDMRFVDDVRSRARLAPRQDPYARLGVQPAATTEQIKTAYLGLAKRFHPDRSSSPGLAALQPELQSLFALLKDAYDAVGTAAQRARFDAQQKETGGQPSSRKEEASLALKMGEVLLKKRDFEQAIQKLRRASDLDPSGDALAALAWALVADPKSTPAVKEEAAGLINRALRAPGVTARTYYVAGVLWRTKDPESAVEAFRKALQLDANHSDAALELRLIEQRRGKPAKAGGGVLSGLLFGKRKT